MTLDETARIQFDVENKQWRKDLLNRYRNTLKEVLKKYSSKTAGDLRIKTLNERYHEEYHSVSFFTSIISRKMPICEFTWNPITKELEWIHIVVSDPGKGIATQMRKMMEELATTLQARVLICSYIAERHYDFWRGLRSEGYDFNDVTGEAFKHFS